MESIKNSLTTENLGKKFSSKFDLVNHAIVLAKNMVSLGRSCRVATTVQNPAYWVLLEISLGKDELEDILEEVKEEDDSKEAVLRKILERKRKLENKQ